MGDTRSLLRWAVNQILIRELHVINYILRAIDQYTQTFTSNALHSMYYSLLLHVSSGPGSVVGIATGYGLDGPGIESRWGRDFLHLSKPDLGPTQPPVQWVSGLSRR